MTDYGRGSGSEPWHPEDPLFGDVYDQGHGYQQQPQHPQQQPDGSWQDPYATGQHPQYPQQGYPQQQYPQQPQSQQYPQGQQPQQPQPQQPQYPQQGYPQQANYDPYDTGSHQTGTYGHQDPYGGQQPPQDPYGRPDFYGQNGYPPPQQPQYQQPGQQPMPGQPMPGQQMPGQGQGRPMPGQGQPLPGQQQPGPGQPQQARQPGQQQGHPQEPGARPLRGTPPGAGEWDAEEEGADPREHAFFADHDEDDEDDSPSTPAAGGRRSGTSQPKEGKKRRSGCACLVVMVVLVGGLGGAAYFGHSFYESHFGPAPDYSGTGTGDVQVTIPKGASATTMGNILKEAGVVKSVDAFVSAANKNSKSRTIQAGVYVLKGRMPASAAVTMMLDPKSQNALIIPEGWRATRVYAAIDTKLGLKEGTTAAEVKGADLGLPTWAKGSVEGFLFPAKYSVAKTTKPVNLVKQMINQAKAEYTEDGLEDAATKAGKSPLDLVKIASLVQAEAQEADDFGKVSQVIYNRLDQGMTLQFDSTINYAMGRSTLNTSNKDTQFASPYNTYVHKGLPPGPIDNPGHAAIQAAMNPADGDWLYFVTVKPGDTRFTASYAEHQKNVADFNAYQKAHGG
ncbi:endolytic transglycosylase MltG [Streptomyces sp. NBC_01476]|uniref:endolytic transglycosylase MltG n=1 Tax=Streptomyces sp. NBC_01476 TaxID=2903881 RepID=UPI002E314684|nr:endolytic transglycosylase MltG [Streptomyces sp. NBC_01476]